MSAQDHVSPHQFTIADAQLHQEQGEAIMYPYKICYAPVGVKPPSGWVYIFAPHKVGESITWLRDNEWLIPALYVGE